jgi:hypothetical protein
MENVLEIFPSRSLSMSSCSNSILCTGGDNRGGDLLVLNRTATITVNDNSPIILRQPSGSAGIILSQPLNVTLKAGGSNTISFNGFNDGISRASS